MALVSSRFWMSGMGAFRVSTLGARGYEPSLYALSDSAITELFRYDPTDGWIKLASSDSGGSGDIVHHCLFVGSDGLYVGGHFTNITDPDNNSIKLATSDCIAKYANGAWESLGFGVCSSVGTFPVFPMGYVSGIAEWDGKIIACGTSSVYNRQNSTTFERGRDKVFAWDGSSWTTLQDSGLTADTADKHVAYVWGGDLYIGGTSGSSANPGDCGLIRWNGSGWENMVSPNKVTVRAIIEYDGKLVVGGTFSSIGGVTASNLAVWDGSNWSALGDPAGGVYSLSILNGDLIIAGTFTSVGGVTAKYVARWNGSNWTSLGMTTLETGGVYATTIENQILIACGPGIGPKKYVPGAPGDSWVEMTPYNELIDAGAVALAVR